MPHFVLNSNPKTTCSMKRTLLQRQLRRLMAAGVLALGASAAFAQIAAWQFGSPASAGNEVTYAATTLDANLVAGTANSPGAVAFRLPH